MPADDAVRQEAERLARQARTRLRGVVNSGDPDARRLPVAKRRDQGLTQIRELTDPVSRLRAYIDLAGELAPALPAGCAEHALPVGEWWHSRLADLERGSHV